MHYGDLPHVSDLYCDEATGIWHVSRYAQASAILKSPYVCADDLHTRRLRDLSKRTGQDLDGLFRVLSWFVFQNEGETHKNIRRGITAAASTLLAPDKAELLALSETLCQPLQADVPIDALMDVAEPFFDAQMTTFLGIPADDVRDARVLFRDMISIPFSMQRMAWFQERNETALRIWERLGTIGSQQSDVDMPEGVTLAHVVASLTFAQEAVIALTARMLVHLSTDADLQSDLREHPEKLGDFVHETLRLLTSFRYLWRGVQGGDVEVLGKVFSPGTRFQFDLLALNLDMSSGGVTDLFDVNPPRSPHVSFAIGRHKCMGLRNTYMSVETLLATLLTKFEIKPADQAISYGRIDAIQRPVSAPVILQRLHLDASHPTKEHTL